MRSLIDVNARAAAVKKIEDTSEKLREASRKMAKISRKTDGIRARLLGLKTRLNTFTYIAAMPPEILEEIFFQCLCQHRRRSEVIPFMCLDCDPTRDKNGPSQNPTHVRQLLSEVCSDWKSFVEASPRLWTVISGDQGYSHLLEAFLRSARRPLSIELDVGQFEGYPIGSRHREAIRAVRGVCKRLRRIENLTINNWAYFLEEAFLKYEAIRAPLLRRLAILNLDMFLGRESFSDGTFPYILGFPCPSLQVLVLQSFSPSSVCPSMVPALQELVLEDRRCHYRESSPYQIDEILELLENLPQLKRVSIALQVYRNYDLDPDCFKTLTTKTVTLPNVKSLILGDMCMYILCHFQLPTCVSLALQDQDHPWRMPGDWETICNLLVSYMSRRSVATGWDAISAQKICIDISTWHEVDLRAIGHSARSAENHTVRCTFKCDKLDEDAQKHFVTGLYRTVRPQYALELEVRAQSGPSPDGCSLVGFDSENVWTFVMEVSPLIEVLHVRGDEAGKALFDALRLDEPDTSKSPWPLRALKQLVLCPSLGGTGVAGAELGERIRSYVFALLVALTARKEYGYLLEDLEIDAEGTFTEDEFASVMSLATRVTLRHTRPRNTVPSTSVCGEQMPGRLENSHAHVVIPVDANVGCSGAKDDEGAHWPPGENTGEGEQGAEVMNSSGEESDEDERQSTDDDDEAGAVTSSESERSYIN